MPERYVENPGPNTMFVAGFLIPPGEGRTVREEYSTEPAAADDAKPLAPADGELAEAGIDHAALLAKPLRELVPLLPGLGEQDLADLATAEGARETPRSTLLNAIAAEQLTRAQARAGGATT